jgi:hypothetical protein
VVEIDKAIGGPQTLVKFFTRYQFARLFEQRDQNGQRLLLKVDYLAALPKLTATRIQLKGTEAHQLSYGSGGLRQGTSEGHRSITNR